MGHAHQVHGGMRHGGEAHRMGHAHQVHEGMEVRLTEWDTPTRCMEVRLTEWDTPTRCMKV